MTYQRFNEIITEMKARPDTDPAVILAEHVGPLVDICEGINDWLRDNREWDLRNEPPWYNAFVCEIARFSVDLSPIWQEYRAEAASLD